MTGVRVIIAGGGLAGCAAGLVAARLGAQVSLFEKSDMLSGAGVRACRMDFNGKIMASLEAKALGAGEIFEALESITIHRGALIEEDHGYIFNAALADPVISRLVRSAVIDVHLKARVKDAVRKDGSIKSVRLENGELVPGDVFIDATGSAGGIPVCKRYGKGCVMCLHRCYVFGDRISIATRAGARELSWLRRDGTPGRLSPSVTLFKQTLKPELLARLEKDGILAIRLPDDLVDQSKLNIFSMLRTRRQMEYINISDVGLAAKISGIGYLALSDLRRIPGFENALYEHPVGASNFNFINHISVTPRDDSMRVKGFQNLFVAGEKAAQGGINEVVGTAIVAGNNAVRAVVGADPLILPSTTAIGDYISYCGKLMDTEEGLKEICTMAHGVFFERMKKSGLYTPDQNTVNQRIADLGLSGILAKPVV